MIRFILLALRNVARNKRRTIIVLATIIICVTMSILVRGIVGSAKQAIIENITKTLTGDLQLYPKGFTQSAEAMPLNLSFKEGGVVEQALKSNTNKLDFARRIRFAGIIYGKEQKNSVFIAMGVEPLPESIVCPHIKNRFLVQGTYLGDRSAKEALLSKPFAEMLDLEVGDVMTLLGTTLHGSMSVADFKVVGLLEASIPTMDKKMLYIPLGAAQAFLDMDGRYTEMVAAASTLEESRQSFESLALRFSDKNSEAEVYFWTDSAKLFKTIITFQEIMIQVVTIIFFIIATAAIFNTMLMAVLERIKEIGIVRALGMRRRQVMAQFITEAAIIGFIGALVGEAIGVGIVTLLGHYGIVFYPPGSYVPIVLLPTTDALSLIFVGGLAVLTAMIAVLWPATFASRIGPMEALRKI